MATAVNAQLRLEQVYDDELPRLVNGWLSSKKSENTRRAYDRGFAKWETFCRGLGVHPLDADLDTVNAYARLLEATGKPNTSQAHALSVPSSFYKHAIRSGAVARNPFDGTDRPKVDQDHSDTEGLTEDETRRLIEEAHRLSPRAYALCLLLYTTGLRVDGILGADVDDVGYDRGHRVLTVRLKGGTRSKVVLAPMAVHALEIYLAGRAEGPLFTTRNGHRLREAEVWKVLRRLAKRAGLPQQNSIHPHVLRHGFITDALAKGVPLTEVQDAVGHKDPRTTRRYDRARNRLDNSPTYIIAASLAQKLEHLDA
jgi:integrase/recombinase XerD